MERKTVIHILSTWQVSGAENVAIEIIKGLEQDYRLIYVSPNGPIQETLQKEGIEYYPINKMTLVNIWNVKHTFNPHLVHAHDVRATILARIVFGPKKVVSHLHVNPHDMNKVTFKALLFLVAQFQIPKIVIVNKSIEEKYIFNKLINGKTVHIRNIIDSSKIIKKSTEDFEEYDVVFIGRLSEQKNPLRAIEIFKGLTTHTDNKTLRMAMLGDGPLYSACKKKISDLGMEEQVFLNGFKDNPYPILVNAKLLLMTSRFEGYPMIALEALALGVPIVSTPVDGMNEIITDNYNGWLIEDNNDFINIINKVINEPTMREALKVNARSTFKRINSREIFKDKLKNIYQEYLCEEL